MSISNQNIKDLHIQLLSQLDHIHMNNYLDDNYLDQVSYVEKQLHNLEQEELYSLERSIKDFDPTTKLYLHKYEYNGPIYRFNNYIGNSGKIITESKSLIKAKSNILFRIKSNLGFKANAGGFKIDESRIKLL